MFPGGVAALLLQSLHPLAMAGVAGHSGYKGDPWGRLQRTSHFLATTTFGTVEDAEAAIERVRGIHERVRGHDPKGRPYRASDPRLLRWVHVAEAHSFLTAHQRYALEPLTAGEADTYVAQSALVAGRLGATDLPTTVAELDGGPGGLPPRARGDRRGPRGGPVPPARPAAALGGSARLRADRLGRRGAAPPAGRAGRCGCPRAGRSRRWPVAPGRSAPARCAGRWPGWRRSASWPPGARRRRRRSRRPAPRCARGCAPCCGGWSPTWSP